MRPPEVEFVLAASFSIMTSHDHHLTVAKTFNDLKMFSVMCLYTGNLALHSELTELYIWTEKWNCCVADLRVVGLLQLCPCRKYWWFSSTGIRLIPITTASGPASRVQGVMIPWLTWWSGLAESSSPLITATGPAGRRQKS